MAKIDQPTTIERVTKAARGVSTTQAAVAGAGILGGIAIGAALFGGWRKGAAATTHAITREPQIVDETAVNDPVSATDPVAPVDLAAAEEEAVAADEDAAKLHALGTPTTLPIDDAPQSYTGGGEPDMAVDYIPGEDTGSTGTGETRAL